MISDQRLLELSLSDSEYNKLIGVPIVYEMARELIVYRRFFQELEVDIKDITSVCNEILNKYREKSKS